MKMTPERYKAERHLYTSLRHMMRETGCSWHSIREAAGVVLGEDRSRPDRQPKEPAPAEPQITEGKLEPEIDIIEMPLPSPGEVSRYIITSAQNNTAVHSAFLKNLEYYAEFHRAELLVSGFTYKKAEHEQLAGIRGGATKKREIAFGYAPELLKYMVPRNTRINLCPGLDFCAEVDIRPTAHNPLSGMDTYTKTFSGIIPHAKMAMVSVPTMKSKPCKFMYTTGCVTAQNYVARKEGQKAAFHHVFGALIVEVDDRGSWWARQLIANDDGSFHDLHLKVDQGSETVSPAAVILGDIHAEQEDAEVWKTTADMLRFLDPANVVVHDLLDFRPRNHHSINNALEQFEKHVFGQGSVQDALNCAGEKLQELQNWTTGTIHIVESNHDQALQRWLDEADYRDDPLNAVVFLKLQLRRYEDRIMGFTFPFLERALFPHPRPDEQLNFLAEDTSLMIEGVECGIHGHRGTNGSRGSPRGFSRIGAKTFTGHTHSAGIYLSCWTVGLTGNLDQGYNKGPSSWSHTHGLIYEGGKRALITIPADRKDKWRA